MTPKDSTARVVEAPPEIGPVDSGYLKVEPTLTQELSGVERLWLLWDKRRFLGRVIVWALAVSTVVVFLIPNRYESSTRLMPPDSQSSSGMAMMAALAGGGSAGTLGLTSLASELLGMKSSGALFVDILGGRTIQDRLIDRFDLRRVYWDRYWEDARKDLTKRTDIKEDRKSGIITITVTDRNRYRAEQMTQAYVEELDKLVANVSTSSARRERMFIEQRLQVVKGKLDDASRQFSDYASKSTTVDLSEQGKATVEAAAKLEGELIAGESELEGLEQIYTKNNVRVRSLQARVDELRAQLHKVGGETSDATSNAPQTGSNNSSSDKANELEFPSIRQLPKLGVRWADLYREAKIQETVYELLTKQYELAKIQEAKEIPTVKVLDAAYVPEKKSFPPRLLLICVLTALSFIGSALWLLSDASWQRMDPQDDRKVFAQTIFGSFRRRWKAMVKRTKANLHIGNESPADDSRTERD